MHHAKEVGSEPCIPRFVARYIPEHLMSALPNTQEAEAKPDQSYQTMQPFWSVSQDTPGVKSMVSPSELRGSGSLPP